jgi:xanthine dehydrogenase accessory factor
MDDLHAVYQALATAEQQGTPCALATVIQVQGSVPRHTGSKMLIYADQTFVGTVGGGKMEALVIAEGIAVIREGSARITQYTLNDITSGDPGICGGTVQVFIEPIQIAPTLLVIGIGHVGRALAQLGKWAEFRVIACDDRAEYCSPETLPNMDAYVICKPHEVAAKVEITPNTYIACVTRGLPVDIDLIPSLLNTPAAYIGLIGSQRRWALTAAALQKERGLTAQQLARIHAPIGLELQAETPKEIAVSIMAEIVMSRRGGTGAAMRSTPSAGSHA